MAEFVNVAKTSELSDGQMKKIISGNEEILLAKVGGQYYATQNRCQHMGGNLSGGVLNGTIVTCPRHHSQYDLKDGHVVRWTDWSGVMLALAKIYKMPKPLKIYQVKTQGDDIQIAIEQKEMANVA